jgi:hypothetical protein
MAREIPKRSARSSRACAKAGVRLGRKTVGEMKHVHWRQPQKKGKREVMRTKRGQGNNAEQGRSGRACAKAAWAPNASQRYCHTGETPTLLVKRISRTCEREKRYV